MTQFKEHKEKYEIVVKRSIKRSMKLQEWDFQKLISHEIVHKAWTNLKQNELPTTCIMKHENKNIADDNKVLYENHKYISFQIYSPN